MDATIKLDQENSGSTAVIRLSGQIDENADYSAANFDGLTELTFDLEKITLINSTGLQKWISFLEQIPSSINVIFTRCTPRIVNQINLFPGFLAGKSISINNFFAPYFCEDCDASHDMLIEFSDIKSKEKPAAPEMSCPTCQKPMDFDGIEKKFFLFITR